MKFFLKKKTDLLAVQVLEDLLQPVVQGEVYLEIWGLLFDMARDLSPEEYLELQEKESSLVLEETAKQALMAHVLEVSAFYSEYKITYDVL